MTIEQAKNIRIADYLQSLGHTPTKINGNTMIYLSPLRDEKTASFKVDAGRNIWYDFGAREGGNILDLVMMLNNTRSVSEALVILDRGQITPASCVAITSYQETATKLENMTIEPLKSPALTQFLKDRNISLSVAERWCREIHYNRNGKRYFSIAFANDKGGYEMRNKYFKGCVAPKTVTSAGVNSTVCYLFEGFMDFLSFKTLEERTNKPIADYTHIVLNSTSLVSPELIDHLRGFETVHTFLDNDTGGKAATAKLCAELGDKVVNRSVGFSNYKDVNDFLCGKRLAVDAPATQQRVGRRM